MRLRLIHRESQSHALLEETVMFVEFDGGFVFRHDRQFHAGAALFAGPCFGSLDESRAKAAPACDGGNDDFINQHDFPFGVKSPRRNVQSGNAQEAKGLALDFDQENGHGRICQDFLMLLRGIVHVVLMDAVDA